MDFTFLSGRIPLTKTISYNARDDSYVTTPYPMISRVSSHETQAANLRELAKIMREEGRRGRCLLKGRLDQTLQDESRAGHSIEEDHEWVVFDFDKVDCEPSVDGAIAAVGKYLPPEAANTDCVVQLSSSCYDPRTTKLSAHVFMLLAKPMSSDELKSWLEWINFNGALRNEIRLTDSQMGLHFPLDRTVASASKLIYIAPPKLVGFEDIVGESIHFVAGKNRKIEVRGFTPMGSDQLRDKLNELRQRAGLPDRSYNLVHSKGQEILTNAEESVVHDLRKSGDSYIRFNLNGGDSLAYFINVREPHLIGNHKGEPYLYTREVAPDLFKTLTKASKALPQATIRTNETLEPLAFYATNRGSAVYIGSYDRATDELRVDQSTEHAAKSWMMSHGLPPTTLPHMDLVTDMSSDIRYEPGYPIINLYQKTDLMKQFAQADRVLFDTKDFREKCPVLWRTLISVHGNSAEAATYFINWLAAIFQERRLTKTAWVWHGNQGTGKGMLVENLLRPLLGESVVRQVNYTLINDKFNGFLDGALIINVDEADLSYSMDRSELRSKLYNWIAEPRVAIRDLRTKEYWVDNTANFIFTSNSSKPVQIEPGDRRFNVGERQDQRLIFTPNEYAILATGEELPEFARLLGLWSINERMLLHPYSGDAKQSMYEATHSLPERIARAIHEGDTGFFIESRPTPIQLQSDLIGKPLPIGPYDELLKAMVEGNLNVLRRDDLYVLFRVVIGHNERLFPDNNAEQKRTFQKLGLLFNRKESHRDKRNGKVVNGIKSPDWDASTEVMALYEQLITSLPERRDNVIPMR